MSFLGDTSLGLVTRGLDIGLKRQKVLSTNIANLDTPGFTPGDVDFAGALKSVEETGSVRMKRTHNGHLAIGATSDDINTVQNPDRAASRDGNSVDIDVQMARIAQNAITYQANTKAVSKKLALLKYVSGEGGM